jgi:Type I phosphodiesterase / nucleotide pyrophosphatase
MGRRLLVLHIDGVSAHALEAALRDGDMPFVQSLIDREGYALHRYRCGLPSTTPFAQAGILYGDNREIPSFRWWDREHKVLVEFGARSTFDQVAGGYFIGCEPLTRDGACLAACYPAGAADDFGIAYQDRSYGRAERSSSAAGILVPYLANPVHVGDWLWQALAMVGRTAQDYTEARAAGRRPARAYVMTNLVEEIFVHHLTRYAVERAMREGYSPIYAGFYAFDEAAHAFGPTDPAARRVMKHLDHTIRKLAHERCHGYELLVLSDHGQVDTVPFRAVNGRHLGEVVAGVLPGYRVQEMKGGAYGPAAASARGTLNVTMSGGLSHAYFAERSERMGYRDLVSEHGRLVRELASMREVALMMCRDGDQDVFLVQGREARGEAVKPLLAGYDDPDVLFGQLCRLNSCRQAGDIVLFGSFLDGRQVNFENQAGGHGSIGGEQLHPFVLARREWGLDTSQVQGADELHPLLCRLRDRLAST